MDPARVARDVANPSTGPGSVAAAVASSGTSGLAAPAAFAACALVWGTTFLVIRTGNEAAPPFLAAGIRLAIAAVILALLVWMTKGSWPSRAALPAVIGYGVLEFGINFPLLYWGELEVPSGMAAVFYATIPLTTSAFGWLLGTERPRAQAVFGAGLAVAGVAVVFAGELTANVPVLPLLAVFAAATCAALATVVLQTGPPAPVLGTNAIACAIGVPFCLASSLSAGEPLALPDTAEAWWPIIYLILAGSLGAFLLFNWLLLRWPASRASMVTVVVPVVAVALGALFAGERPPAIAFAGAALVLVGVAVVLKTPPRPTAAGGHQAVSPGN